MNTSNPYDGERIAGSVGFPLEGRGDARHRSGERAAASGRRAGHDRGPRAERLLPAIGVCRRRHKRNSAPTASSSPATSDAIDERGYVYVLGRGKDLVITGGYNVYPKEIELAIDALPGVVESAVIGLPHPDLGEAVTAVVVG